MHTRRLERFNAMVSLKANGEVKESVEGWFVSRSRVCELPTGERFAVLFAVSPDTAARDKVDDFFEYAFLHAAIVSWVKTFHRDDEHLERL